MKIARHNKSFFDKKDFDMSGNSEILNTALHNFEEAVRRLNIKKDIAQKILNPCERVEINISPKMPNGQIVCMKAFIVRHSDRLGPAKGGIRMTPTVTLDEITGLAMEMTWKTSLIGVPFGGGKSGIRYDPRQLSEDDKEITIRCFTRGALHHIGPEIYIPAPDMGTNEVDMGHIRDCVAYSGGTAITKGCFVTGKPIILGGIVGRREATGKGVVCTIAAACKKLDLDIGKLRVSIQGFGNVGAVAAQELARLGARVIAVSDMSGCVINEKGLALADLAEHLRATGSMKGFAGASFANSSEVFQVDCDCFIPAAAGSQITDKNAHHIKARIVAEGANSPTTPQADRILSEKQVFVIPDILCNAGGVFVSYLEYVQETQRDQMTLDVVERRLRERMQSKFDEVFAYAGDNNLTMRQAAMDIALDRVYQGVISRGLWP